MSHLSAERLAALADAGEWPTPAEAAHLGTCPECAEERLAYDVLVAGARAERSAIGMPLTTWEGVAAGLRAAGASAGPRRPPAIARDAAPLDLAARRRLVTRVTRVAAGVVLLLGGALIGRMSALVGPFAEQLVTLDTPRAMADAPSVDDFVPDYSSITEAQAALARHSVAYQHAAAYLAQTDSAAWLDTPDDYRTRLVALERAGRTMREAMEEAPYDPVLTGYYLTTLGQREATLRQLNVVLPATERLNSF